MAGPPTAAFSQLIVRYGGTGLPHGAVTTHGITTPVGDIGDVLLAIEGAATEFAACMASSVTILDVLWKVGPEATGPSTVVPVGIIGSSADPQCPPQVAYLIRLPVVGLSGRFAGRFYLPGCIEPEINHAGLMNPGLFTAVQNAALDFYADLATVGSEPVVFSTVSSDPRTVDAVQAQLQVGTVRRRNRR